MAVSAEQLSAPGAKSAQQRTPSSQALLPLAGLRALANIGIVVFHIILMRPPMLDGAAGLQASLDLRPVHALYVGLTGMDVLFLLCGFHAALSLVPALTRPGASPRQVVLQYWWRRAVRIIPAYYFSMAVTWFALLRPSVRTAIEAVPEAAATLTPYDASCPGGLWANAAFVSAPGCGLHYWSQSTMAHFWLLVPLALAVLRPRQPGFHRRIALGAGATIVLGSVFRVWAIVRYDINLPMPMFPGFTPAETGAIMTYLHRLHMPLAGRAASMAVGVLLALPFTAGSGSLSSSVKQRTGVAAASVAAAAVLLAHSSVRVFGHMEKEAWSRSTSLPFLAVMLQGGAGISLALALLAYACMTRVGLLGRVGYRVLSAKPLARLADLSYSAYLYHIQARVWVWWSGLLPGGLITHASDMTGLGVEVAVTLAATFAIAFLSFHLVERPAANLLHRFGGTSGVRLFSSTNEVATANGTCDDKVPVSGLTTRPAAAILADGTALLHCSATTAAGPIANGTSVVKTD